MMHLDEKAKEAAHVAFGKAFGPYSGKHMVGVDAAVLAYLQTAAATPDVDGLVDEANAAQEWMREPDWAENFSPTDMVDWLNKRPISLLSRIMAALSSERAAHEQTKRERDEDRHEFMLLDQRCDRRGLDLAIAEARIAELEKALKPFSEAAANFDDMKTGNPHERFIYGGRDNADGRVGEISVADLRAARRALGGKNV